MKLLAFLIAEYAAVATDGKATIAGTFDNVDVSTPDGSPIAPGTVIPLPNAYLVAYTLASLGEGLVHQMRLRVVDGNGEPISEDVNFPITFEINPFGRPLRNTCIMQLRGLTVRGADDYVFLLYKEGEQAPLGEFVFSVTDTSTKRHG